MSISSSVLTFKWELVYKNYDYFPVTCSFFDDLQTGDQNMHHACSMSHDICYITYSEDANHKQMSHVCFSENLNFSCIVKNCKETLYKLHVTGIQPACNVTWRA